MDRCRFLLTSLAGVLAAPLAAEAQPAGKVPKIGVLHPGSGTKLLFAALAEVGYVEGRSVVIERRYAEGRLERLPTLAVELVGLKPDIILATGPEAIQAAKNATKTIPIVMVFSGDPERVELLKAAVPLARRLALLGWPRPVRTGPHGP